MSYQSRQLLVICGCAVIASGFLLAVSKIGEETYPYYGYPVMAIGIVLCLSSAIQSAKLLFEKQ